MCSLNGNKLPYFLEFLESVVIARSGLGKGRLPAESYQFSITSAFLS